MEQRRQLFFEIAFLTVSFWKSLMRERMSHGKYVKITTLLFIVWFQ